MPIATANPMMPHRAIRSPYLKGFLTMSVLAILVVSGNTAPDLSNFATTVASRSRSFVEGVLPPQATSIFDPLAGQVFGRDQRHAGYAAVENAVLLEAQLPRLGRQRRAHDVRRNASGVMLRTSRGRRVSSTGDGEGQQRGRSTAHA